MPSGYYRHPTIHQDSVVFVCEDDLWITPAAGGVARRLTSGLGEASWPHLSPDGEHIALVGREEGNPEVYLMPASGGQTRRLTFLGGDLCEVVSWTQDGKILFTNNANTPFQRLMHLHTVDLEGGPPERLPLGPARTIAYNPDGEGAVLGRNTGDPARWKRYRGGTAGQLWIDTTGEGEFHNLIDLEGNLASPMWLAGRIFFLSDHEGVGNLYSCTPAGEDLQRHTDHEDFYARNASTDGQRIVYHCGADLYLFDPQQDENRLIEVAFYSPQTQRNRKFVSPARYLQSWTLHPEGHSVAVSVRGKPFTFANWEGAVRQYGQRNGARYRLPTWLNDGQRLLAVTDEAGEERLVLFHTDQDQEPVLAQEMDLGRLDTIAVNPRKDQIAFSNHRYEIQVLDLESGGLTLIDRGKSGPISGFDWSLDGNWLVYSVSISVQTSILRLWDAQSGETHDLTRPVLRDYAPAFDQQGKYIYFLSRRHFDPVYDNLQFDLNFPRGAKPYLITLQKDLPSPFIPVPRPPGAPPGSQDDQDDEQDGQDPPTPQPDEEQTGAASDQETTQPAATEAPKGPLQIDLEGIQDRVIAFPVEEGRYGRILGTKDGKVLYSWYPIEGALRRNWRSQDIPANGTLVMYDFDKLKEESLLYRLTDFALNLDGSVLIYRSGYRLRVLKAGVKPDKSAGNQPGRQSGWLDLDRVKVSILPGDEWKQMFREAWRLQRDQFWTPDMSRVDWVAVHDRYLPLVDRVSSRSEFSDLMWEMQGELGTSHCYELGGDYRPEPNYRLGDLGADFEYDPEQAVWHIASIVMGDSWDAEANSPLNQPGLNLAPGDQLLAVNGLPLARTTSPASCLVNLAGSEVTLRVRSQADGEARSITVKTLREGRMARYRQWVEANRRYVHQATEGRVGYLHIPDMGPRGYAEFHRYYLTELEHDGLIVDLRFNRGGHVSSLLLEKLARRRIGYDVARWYAEPVPYPPESVPGPMVALTNEFAGSDGDIFSHGFKLLGLGPLIGKRTWGGVVGIWPRHSLVDGTITTQPEFSFWFEDVGWGVENYGTEPDIEVDITPQDYARGVDTQLERAIQETLRLLEENPPRLPDFDPRPDRALPRLPRRDT